MTQSSIDEQLEEQLEEAGVELVSQYKKHWDSTETVIQPQPFPENFFGNLSNTRDGLKAEEKRAIIEKSTDEINVICAVRGAGKLKLMYNLAQIKKQYVKEGTNDGLGKWLQFLEGGYIGISKDVARELVSAWENLYGKPDAPVIPGWVVDSWSSRTNQLVANFDDVAKVQDAVQMQQNWLTSTTAERKEKGYVRYTDATARRHRDDKPLIKERKMKTKEQQALQEVRNESLKFIKESKTEGDAAQAAEEKLRIYMNLSSSLLQMKAKVAEMQKELGKVDADEDYIKQFTKLMGKKKLPVCDEEQLKELNSAFK